MRLIVDKIYHARRVIREGDDVTQHYADLKAYLIEEVKPQGFKFERNGNELVVIGYCGEFIEEG
jgi:hypothetical protein